MIFFLECFLLVCFVNGLANITPGAAMKWGYPVSGVLPQNLSSRSKILFWNPEIQDPEDLDSCAV